MVRLAARRALVHWAREAYQLSERGACRAVRVNRASIRYQSRRPHQHVLRQRLREFAQVRLRAGYQQLYVLLRREGWRVNHKPMVLRRLALSIDGDLQSAATADRGGRYVVRQCGHRCRTQWACPLGRRLPGNAPSGPWSQYGSRLTSRAIAAIWSVGGRVLVGHGCRAKGDI